MPITVASDVFRSDAFRLVVGELIASAGVVALVLHWSRSRSTDRSTLYFGLAALLYGLRLIVELEALHSAFPSVPWRNIESSITLVIGLPFVLYVGSTIGRAYPWFIRGVVAANVLVAILGTIRMAQQAPMEPIWFLTGVLTVASLVGWIYIGAFPKMKIDREVRALRIGFIVLGCFALYQNLSVTGVLPQLGFLEPVGMVFLLGTFFYVSASRSLRMETNLIAIRNELDIARQIQSALLPELNGAIAGLEIHARYLPVGSVAGDFYDVLSSEQGQGVLIADVSGHGIPAALSASMVKVALKAQADHAANPAEVLAGLNNILCGILRGQYITAAYVFCDIARRELRYGGAGHPPVLLWRSKQGKVESLEENGFFLGPFPSAEYTSLCTTFEPGDRCLLFTDGLVEASNRKGEEFGAFRLSQFLAANSGIPANTACGTLLTEVARWSGLEAENQQDDITFVLVEYPETGVSVQR